MFQTVTLPTILAILVLWCNAALRGQEPVKEVDRRPMKYLALGDSYTIGEAVRKKKRMPMQLAKRLREAGIDIEIPEIVAESGWTTDELSAAIDKAKPAPDHDLVTLLIGVNNQYRDRSAEDYQGEFRALLKRAIKFASGDAHRVIVISIPDYGVTPFIANKPDRDPRSIARELDAFNAAAKKLTIEFEAHWVDVTRVSRQRGQESKMLAKDELHPSAKMYGLWIDEVFPVALEILKPANKQSASK